MSLRGQHILQAPKCWASKPLDLVWPELEYLLSCHNPRFELNWAAMPKQRGPSDALSSLMLASLLLITFVMPILANPLSFGNFTGSVQWQPASDWTAQAKIRVGWFGAALGPAVFDPDTFPIPAYWILAKSATSSWKKTNLLCVPDCTTKGSALVWFQIQMLH